MVGSRSTKLTSTKLSIYLVLITNSIKIKLRIIIIISTSQVSLIPRRPIISSSARSQNMIECLRRFLVNIARVFLPKDGTNADNNGSEDQPIVTSKSPKQYSTNFTTESMRSSLDLKCTKVMERLWRSYLCVRKVANFPNSIHALTLAPKENLLTTLFLDCRLDSVLDLDCLER